MARAAIQDPMKVFRFRVVIDGFVRFGFSEASGLSKETAVVEYREGGMNETPQKSAGLTTYGDITLKRGQYDPSLPGANDFLNWVNQVHRVAVMGNAEQYRKDIEIEQYNAVNQRVRSWKVSHAWPKSHKAFGDLNATSNDNSLEELVLAHEGFELA